MTTINGEAKLTGEIKHISSDNNTSHLNYINTLVSDNISVSIVRSASSESSSYIFRGYTVNNSTTPNATTLDNITISADMPKDTTIYRFDFTVISEPTDSKNITFYYPSLGYISADISTINDLVSAKDTITMRYKSAGFNNGSCTFTPQEIGTKDFDCKGK